jgi:signal transduction histidine kinase/DNA-binding response OmpR family regulator
MENKTLNTQREAELDLLSRDREALGALVEQHEMLTKAVHAMPHMFYVVKDDRLLFCNRQLADFYNLPEGVTVAGTPWRDLMQAILAIHVADKTARVDDMKAEVLRRIRENGRFRRSWALEDGRHLVIEGMDGGNGLIIVTYSDITVLKNAQRKAEASERAKAAFLANMSHEIRTPMNAILGFTEILAGLVTDRQQQEYLRAVQSSGKSLLRLINDILDLSKVEAGKLELVYGAVNPRELFTEMEQIFSQKIAEKNLKLIIDIGPGLPPALLLDEVRLRQILVNLIGNAIKFTDQGHIRLSARSLYPEADHSTLDLVFEVEDTGMGIAKQQQEKVFGAFEQQSGQSLDKYGGTGLGLAITKRLVEIMGGEIHLGSTPGQGSTFHVTLKRVRVASVAELATHAVPAIDADTVSFSAATLLVVDDIAVNRSLIRGYLAQYGFGILEAANGQEAIEITRARQPDLILMDMRMPVLNGYEATRKIKQQPEIRQIPVIALTASAMAQDAKEITGLCDGYLRKPVSKPDLVAELIRFLPHSIAEPAPETVAGTAETPPWPPVSLDTGTRQRLAELLPVLQGQQERCDKLGKTMSINDIEAFALQMQQQGSDYGYPPLVSWGKRLADRAVMFDLSGIAETLDSFPHCIRELEAMLTG